jgi:hypothetical protein
MPGLDRFATPAFGVDEAEAIHRLIADGHRAQADEQLRHLVHLGVAPTELFEAAMALQRRTGET